MAYSKEALMLQQAQLAQGYNVSDRFGLLEAMAQVVRDAVTSEREQIIEALKKLPGSNGRRAEDIIRGRTHESGKR